MLLFNIVLSLSIASMHRF